MEAVKRDGWQEVQNYVKAINFGIEKVKELPLSSRLIKNIHKVLLSNGRGEHKSPGEYRKSQNWIGGSSINSASFIPPIHTLLNDYIADLEDFIHEENNTPLLIKIALIHYQFETIHPFLDENGRIGRLIIPLYLLNNKKLANPCFYIPNYFEKNRIDYYDNLNRMRLKNDMSTWIKFFLKGIIEVADDTKLKFKDVLNFMKDIENRLDEYDILNSSMRKVINYIYSEPTFTRKDLIEGIGLKDFTARKVINSLIDLKLISETTGFSRNRVYVFKEYIDIFKSNES